MYTAFKEMAFGLIEGKKEFKEVQYSTDLYLGLTGPTCPGVTTASIRKHVVEGGGGSTLRFKQDFGGIKGGAYLLVVDSSLVSVYGKDSAVFVLGHEYGHYISRTIVSVNTNTIEEIFEVESACDKVGVQVTGQAAGLHFFDTMLNRIKEGNARILSDKDKVIKLLNMRREAIA